MNSTRQRIINTMICLVLLPLTSCIFIKPKTLDFGSDETTKTFTLTVIGNIEWSINYSESWLTVEPNSGQGTVTISVTVDRTGLKDDYYEEMLSISTNPSLLCPDVIVKMTVGEVTTSTTTTTMPRGSPDPYFLDDYWAIGKDYDPSVTCYAWWIYRKVSNKGEAGDIFAKGNYYSKSDCIIFHMDKGEEERILGFHFFGLCPPDLDIESNYTWELRPAETSDFPDCKKPPHVTITSPIDYRHKEGESITFEGYVTNSYDGNMPASSLVWTSDKDGRIGTGTSFTKNDLSVGDHTITFTATDSLGDEGTDSMFISIYKETSVVWEFETGGWVESSPTISNGYVYIGSRDNKVYCLDSQTGSKVWDFDTGWGGVETSPAVIDGYVYIESGYILYCLDALTGNKIWEFDVHGPIDSSPAVAEGNVYFGYYEGLYCLDALTGDVVWEFNTGSEYEIGPSVESCPAVVDGYVYFIDYSGNVYCFNAKTGDQVWKKSIGDDTESSPVVSAGKIYVGSDYHLFCLQAQTGDIVWKSEEEVSLYSTPSVVGSYVYIEGANEILCLDAINGNKVWEFEDVGPVGTSPAVTGDYVYILGWAAYCVDAKTGDYVWEFPISSGNSSPAVYGGYVYIGSASKVYCLKAADGDTGSWPMFKYNPARTGSK